MGLDAVLPLPFQLNNGADFLTEIPTNWVPSGLRSFTKTRMSEIMTVYPKYLIFGKQTLKHFWNQNPHLFSLSLGGEAY